MYHGTMVDLWAATIEDSPEQPALQDLGILLDVRRSVCETPRRLGVV